LAACLLATLVSVRCFAQGPPPDPESTASPEFSAPETNEAAQDEGSVTSLDLSEEGSRGDRAGAALRNENVFASKLDADTQKADNNRIGGSYSIVSRQPAELKFYAVEYGETPAEPPLLNRLANLANAWHLEVFESLQNSVFNARTFFQAGPVLPSRMNQYGARFSGPLPRWGFLSGSFGQTKNRGMVNGNVLVPLLSERNPLATDPAVRAVVERFLGAYPLEEPNRTDIDSRALNTNAPQTIDATDADLRLDGKAGDHGMLSLSHNFNRQTIRAFQLVAGQNPDTEIHSQRARANYRVTLSDATEYSIGAEFFRVRSDLHPEPNSVGPRVRFSGAIESLGPQAQYPLNRAENKFRYGTMAVHRFAGGRHTITFGGDIARYQLNGFEQNGMRGEFGFSNNFGRSAIENLLLGEPTNYTIRIGNYYRGFRSWSTNMFFADQWNALPNLQLYFGLHHSMTTVPSEVNNLNSFPYGTDRNNFSPRFSFAFRGPKDWITRGSYAVSFGEIFPVTYSQIRYNAPGVLAFNVDNPSLTNPLAGIDLSAPDLRTSLTRFSPDLATPYSHQYTFSLERAFGPVNIELGYVGSRSFKLLNGFATNRAAIVPGIPTTTATINGRRPDQRYYDIVEIANGGIAYLDAAQATLRFRALRGFTGGGTYTFGKALDQGSMYNSTAANNDLFGRSQYEHYAIQDRKGLSSFDSTHSLALYGSQRLPRWKGFRKSWAAPFGDLQISGVVLLKTGTPFTVNAGSDSPGFGNVDGAGSDRPSILNPSILGATVGDPDTSRQILNPAYFSFISPGQFAGNLGRNTFRKGPIFNINASVAREWKWGRQRSYLLRLQADAYNLTNHPQFDEPSNQLSSPSFGRITNTLNNGRVLQIGLRFVL